ncbi:HlyD family secretion protein [Zhengella mangrovi]|uniref:HlyD family secretion protein n=1 Tax=Zhengella mangrovi TaxID=1982044 RepID=A0A2G1QM20_9HYPH|nr:HlyD family efflux transporter periplasmic adaptor subunit [Zhengella mangrovi]PHP66519.1 HlyD family secretion protein [Zhengella mangrovi]
MELLCAVPLVAGWLAACEPGPAMVTGYAEAETVLVAPIETARIEVLHVRRGDRVAKGTVLADMEKRDATIAVAQAEAALAQAESQLANISQGKRPEEIAVIEASLNSAEAQQEDAQRTVDRMADLARRGVATQASLDDAKTGLAVAQAKVRELKANLNVARLPARADEIKAARAARDQARASLDNARWRLDNRELTAPEAGQITDVIRNPGELAGPQAPVLALLPQGGVKLKLFVAEPDLSQISRGTVLPVSCDGCAKGMTATVSYVSDEPEFTPPVIYSLENRQKLVYLVEARPDDGAAMLKPGQIVDVRLPGTGS